MPANRWHIGFTDLAAGQGMCGQVEGRTQRRRLLAGQPAA
ncbi:hypothetical protein FF36_06133 [Frankia torreyi]|uniref:Uncharacterized protein n=1 Tax=Frankia torreyi TaxID=1856 RepID=A0A0D8B649_9ACTN|nr:hypothetical protein FF36_06133 [Frankia torreyi]